MENVPVLPITYKEGERERERKRILRSKAMEYNLKVSVSSLVHLKASKPTSKAELWS